MFAYPSNGPSTATTTNTIRIYQSVAWSDASPVVTTRWAPDPDAAQAFAEVFFRRTGQVVTASLLRDSFGRWNALARALQAELQALDVRDREVRRIARRARPLPPHERTPRRRVRTCGAGSSRSARPPEALS